MILAFKSLKSGPLRLPAPLVQNVNPEQLIAYYGLVSLGSPIEQFHFRRFVHTRSSYYYVEYTGPLLTGLAHMSLEEVVDQIAGLYTVHLLAQLNDHSKVSWERHTAHRLNLRLTIGGSTRLLMSFMRKSTSSLWVVKALPLCPKELQADHSYKAMRELLLRTGGEILEARGDRGINPDNCFILAEKMWHTLSVNFNTPPFIP